MTGEATGRLSGKVALVTGAGLKRPGFSGGGFI